MICIHLYRKFIFIRFDRKNRWMICNVLRSRCRVAFVPAEINASQYSRQIWRTTSSKKPTQIHKKNPSILSFYLLSAETQCTLHNNDIFTILYSILLLAHFKRVVHILVPYSYSYYWIQLQSTVCLWEKA